MDFNLIHHPYVLVGLDVLCSALLVVLAVHLATRRFRSLLLRSNGPDLLSQGDPEGGLLGQDRLGAADAEDGQTRGDVEKIARQARKLKRKGLSVEEISRKLETATSEIEMLLALNEIEKTGKASKLRCALS